MPGLGDLRIFLAESGPQVTLSMVEHSIESQVEGRDNILMFGTKTRYIQCEL